MFEVDIVVIVRKIRKIAEICVMIVAVSNSGQ
jgi:hypothetical protein